MAAIITRRLRAQVAKQLYESFDEASPSRFYVALGRPGAWTTEMVPPTPTDTIQTNYDVWRDMIAMKRVTSADRSYVIARTNWTNNTIYTQYTDTNTSLPTSSFYVMTGNNHVYKVIDNALGAASTVKPTGTASSITETADGYRWKYMYTISAADALKFMTTSWLPVKTLTANDGSSQWVVQSAASNGAIHHVVITANGTAYKNTTNVFSSVANSTHVVLNTNAEAVDGVYTYSTIFLESGPGAGQLRRIIKYTGATRGLTVNTAFTTLPTGATRYRIAPNVLIRGDGVTAATAYVANCQGGQVRKITMVNAGTNYSIANVSFVGNGSWGSGAAATPVISPKGGHGSNPVDELYGHTVLMNVQIAGSESNTFPTNNDFRIVSLIADPLLASGTAANATSISTTTKLTISGASGDFTADEIITGGTTGAKARLVWFANTNAARTAGVLNVCRVARVGTGVNFAAGEVVTGATSTRTATLVSRTNPAIRQYTGDVMFIENRTPVTRSVGQTEDLKIAIKF
jgi:hypothetical protein